MRVFFGRNESSKKFFGNEVYIMYVFDMFEVVNYMVLKWNLWVFCNFFFLFLIYRNEKNNEDIKV